MIELMKQKGFTCKPIYDFGDGYCFYNEQMLKDKVLFLSVVLEGECENCDEAHPVFHDYISVYHYSNKDAMEWQLYWDDVLAPLQTYRILMDIYDVYRVFPLERFISMLPELSTGGYTASMRKEGDTTQVTKTERYTRIKKMFRGLKIETN